jgi:metal-responsive CopG/Arc/MetJ family transcriptional regulator
MSTKLKTRITLTLNPELISAIDAVVKKSASSRSAIIEQVLQKWYNELHQMENSYRSLSPIKEEDAKCTQISRAQSKNGVLLVFWLTLFV